MLTSIKHTHTTLLILCERRATHYCVPCYLPSTAISKCSMVHIVWALKNVLQILIFSLSPWRGSCLHNFAELLFSFCAQKYDWVLSSNFRKKTLIIMIDLGTDHHDGSPHGTASSAVLQMHVESASKSKLLRTLICNSQQTPAWRYNRNWQCLPLNCSMPIWSKFYKEKYQSNVGYYSNHTFKPFCLSEQEVNLGLWCFGINAGQPRTVWLKAVLSPLVLTDLKQTLSHKNQTNFCKELPGAEFQKRNVGDVVQNTHAHQNRDKNWY